MPAWRKLVPIDESTSVARSTCSERRRAQVIAAASDCFAERGFHNASIADISKLAGMSSGHIYHYFENKEAIVEAIAEATLDEILEIHADILVGADMLEGLISHAVETSIHFSRLENSRLRLEILSEASRNARLAHIVQTFDRRAKESILEILKCINESRADCLSNSELESQFELISALVSGFLARSVNGPQVNENVLRQSLHRVLFSILMPNMSAQID